jgi:rhamnosyltransferase
VKPILCSLLKPKILVIDSSSTDSTRDILDELSIEHIKIPKNQFNHGLTREYGRKMLGTEIVIMISQDAELMNSEMLEKLVEPIIMKMSAVSYGRQLPKTNATFVERSLREFNYPADSNLRGIDDLDNYGPSLFFCSDAFSAYDNKALDSIGGFKKVLAGEENVAVFELLHKGYKIAYVAESLVYHSHNHGILSEFSQYFDKGYSMQNISEWEKLTGSASGKGFEFARHLFSRIDRRRLHLLPKIVAILAMKYFGYIVGKNVARYSFMPKRIVKALSNQKYYWE